MSYLKLKRIEVDNAVKKLLEPLIFDIQLICTNEIKEGVEFVVLYNVDVHSDNDDQVLSEIEIAPIPKGKVGFKIEAEAPNIDLIPADQLFGLTSIIIIGKYMGQQFIRIGYIVDVSYPGIPTEKLIKNDAEEPSEEIADEEDEVEDEEEDYEEEYEDLEYEEDDEDIERYSEDEDDLEEDEANESAEDANMCKCEGECNCGEENDSKTFVDAVKERILEGKERIFDEEGKNEEDEERVCEDSYSEIKDELNKTVQDEVEDKKEGSDVFEYCGYEIDRNQIEMKLMVPPVISLFEINWSGDADGEHSSIDGEEPVMKRQKTE